jgi:hypothetical protein
VWRLAYLSYKHYNFQSSPFCHFFPYAQSSKLASLITGFLELLLNQVKMCFMWSKSINLHSFNITANSKQYMFINAWYTSRFSNPIRHFLFSFRFCFCRLCLSIMALQCHYIYFRIWSKNLRHDYLVNTRIFLIK